jgi:hypothetical protein
VQSRFLILEAHNEKFEAFKLNQESTKRADEAREVARLSTRVALAAVRKCRAQEGAPEPTEAEQGCGCGSRNGAPDRLLPGVAAQARA